MRLFGNIDRLLGNGRLIDNTITSVELAPTCCSSPQFPIYRWPNIPSDLMQGVTHVPARQFRLYSRQFHFLSHQPRKGKKEASSGDTFPEEAS